MKAIRNLMLFAVAGGFLFLLFGWYSGFFSRSKVEVKTVDRFVAVYQDHKGEYSETLSIQEKIADMLWENGVDNYKNFGIYKAYPQLESYAEKHGISEYHVIEVYDNPGKIRFILPLGDD